MRKSRYAVVSEVVRPGLRDGRRVSLRVPILRLGVTSLVSASDGSGLAGLSLQYNVANESDLFLGVFVPWGRGLNGIDPATGLPNLGSEFGLAPLSVYLESRVFF